MAFFFFFTKAHMDKLYMYTCLCVGVHACSFVL